MYVRRHSGILPALPLCTRQPELVLVLLVTLAGCSPKQLAPSRGDTGLKERDAEAGVTIRPNVVVIMTDDQTVESMRVMPRTLASIGSAGVMFENSIVTYALCCPSRATFLTGQYSHNHG